MDKHFIYKSTDAIIKQAAGFQISPVLLKVVAPLAILLFASLGLNFYQQQQRSLWKTIKNPDTVSLLRQFVTQEKAQAYTDTNGVPPEFRSMFKSAERGDWLTFSNKYLTLIEERNYWLSLMCGERRSNDYSGRVEDWISNVTGKIGWRWEPRSPPGLTGTAGEAVKDMYGALESLAVGNEEYSTQFGREIFNSIPAGSIYLGGPGPGRFLVTAMCQSHLHDNQFCIVAQDELRDEDYRGVLENRYGKEIYIPTKNDQEQCIKEFRDNIERQMRIGPAGSEHFPYLDINTDLAKIMFEKNPRREFYLNEEYPMEWMNLHLEPYGLIFKLNREPAATISDKIVARDHAYWLQRIKPMIGGWLTETTTVAQVVAFVEKIHWRQDLRGFDGDTKFIQNAYWQIMFSRPRSAIAGLYHWRADHSADSADKNRMLQEADFAFRQAWALSPGSLEILCRYVNFLLSQNNYKAALLVANTSALLPQNTGDETLTQLLTSLKEWQTNPPSATHM